MLADAAARALTIWIAGWLLASSVCVPAVRAAEADGGDERWVPSVILRSGFVMQSGEASVRSFLPNGQPLRPGANGSQTQIWPLLGGDLELMTPDVDALPGAPRFFARGGASYSFASSKDVAKEGNPAAFPDPLPTNITFIDGQGSTTNIEIKSPTWEAGLGAAFEFHWWERTVRLRVSAEYMRERIKLRGKVHDAVPFFGAIVPIFLRNDRTEDFDAVGGALGVEFDAMRAGSFVTSVLAEGRIYGWVGDRVLRETDQKPIVAANNLASAVWRYELDPVAYRIHVGFRVRFQPE